MFDWLGPTKEDKGKKKEEEKKKICETSRDENTMNSWKGALKLEVEVVLVMYFTIGLSFGELGWFLRFF